MKIELYFFHEQAPWEDDSEAKVAAYSSKFENSEYRTLICRKEIEIEDVPLLSRAERIDSMVGILIEEKKKIQADAFVAIERIDNKLKELLAIEYKDENK